ncbi:MAG: helix-turn-helix domain-containing protein [Candidatus Omnitrophota bacterium]
MIQEVCRKLREKRRELGYSLEYTVEKTKLHPSMIKDIEDCNLSKINATYLKGFIKIYAAFLNVDLGSSLEEITSSDKVPGPSRPRKERKASNSGISRKVTGILKNIPSQVKKKILFVLAVLFLLWMVFNIGKFIVSKISGVFKSHSAAAKEESKPQDIPISNSKDLTLSLTAKKKCFVKVMVDGRILFEGTLDKGAVESWRGNKKIELKVNDGSAIYMEVNGKAIPALTSMRKPIKSLKITPSGITVDK